MALVLGPVFVFTLVLSWDVEDTHKDRTIQILSALPLYSLLTSCLLRSIGGANFIPYHVAVYVLWFLKYEQLTFLSAQHDAPTTKGVMIDGPH